MQSIEAKLIITIKSNRSERFGQLVSSSSGSSSSSSSSSVRVLPTCLAREKSESQRRTKRERTKETKPGKQRPKVRAEGRGGGDCLEC